MNRTTPQPGTILLPVICSILIWIKAGIPASADPANKLATFSNCRLAATQWADGDSFEVLFQDGTKHTLRLYGADCIEKQATTTTDARRLRAQRRYFGIANLGGSHQVSIDRAKAFGMQAGKEVQSLLKRPFTVTTAFADARGDSRYKRVYAFVETAGGEDLAGLLVSRGLARAFGVCRRRSESISADEYRERLKDLELKAATGKTGVWAFTDWDSLPDERRIEREEEEELALARKPAIPRLGSIDPNSASRDLLMQLPGIGEHLANRIIEGRSIGRYREANDLLRIAGIGNVTLKKLQPFLHFRK